MIAGGVAYDDVQSVEYLSATVSCTDELRAGIERINQIIVCGTSKSRVIITILIGIWCVAMKSFINLFVVLPVTSSSPKTTVAAISSLFVKSSTCSSIYK